MYKKCIKCGAEKRRSEFYKCYRMADGHLNKCIECCREYGRNRARMLRQELAKGNKVAKT